MRSPLSSSTNRRPTTGLVPAIWSAGCIRIVVMFRPFIIRQWGQSAIPVRAESPRLRGASCERVRLGVEHDDQASDPLRAQDRAEFRTVRRQFADGAVQINIHDLPDAGVLPQQIIEV